jgi:hypothetical protein
LREREECVCLCARVGKRDERKCRCGCKRKRVLLRKKERGERVCVYD